MFSIYTATAGHQMYCWKGTKGYAVRRANDEDMPFRVLLDGWEDEFLVTGEDEMKAEIGYIA